MKKIKTEKLSLFVDGELEGPEIDTLLSSMCSLDGDLKSCWHRYHLIGDALRNNLPGNPQHDLAQRVSDALKDEPTLLCPSSTPTSTTPPATELIDSNVTSIATPAHEQPKKSFTGFAVAASVAVVGFVSVSLWGWNIGSESGPTVAVQKELKASALAPVTQSVAISDMRQQRQGAMSVNTTQVDPRLRSYIIDHANSTSSYNRPGLPPNVRVVTFSADQ